MIIDLKSIFIEQLTAMFEKHLSLITIIFVVAAVAFIFRHYITFYLDLSRREENKLTEITLMPLMFIFIAGVGYLYIQEHYFLLTLGLSVILIYFLYAVGILDMIVEKMEGR